ncbi:cytochrome ubiquinol oxidase subunit I [Actinomyces sp. 2119]|uniref:Cytochrome ubiquinol oxidase subunit I n=1 Tax=Actinomyces lilanjuaniae TaxID=2321394 RepID=A0ABN5PT33_9ACTO|nr:MULTISPECIES: cytochrome ubiquinol oxidase subunit I [Actinomyces]AYD90020.1 cytochrome ubiquinol oxidase subunit I [Actinomyces lilanjuaniae]RJF42514.1 cytochrome ubiquinol oxidase subunit I [Actinomyces sp. 2119]
MVIAPLALDSLDLARWQFGITTVYHFILVPLTIGLSPMVALMEALWLRTRNEQWLVAAKFFGKILLINFALGVATGLVQEFQFGMNWSEYSRFVGNIFGAPLAFEALLAFFMESTFLGLWIFGWDRLSPRLHNLCMWAVAAGTNFSAFFILAANSWMQHPVGTVINPDTGRAELDGLSGFAAVLSNPILWTTATHVITSAFLVAGAVVLGVSVWWMTRAARAGQDYEARHLWRRTTRLGATVMLVAGLATAVSGHFQGHLVTEEQPAKMAAAEGLCHTESRAPFTAVAFGDCDTGMTRFISVPGVYSFMATNDVNAEVTGLVDAQQMYSDYVQAHEPGAAETDYTPNVMITFWSFRLMIALGMASVGIGALALWLLRSDRLITRPWLGRAALWTMWLPFVACSFGWIFTEMGRQPWVIVPNLADPVSQVYMRTADGVSTAASAGTVLASVTIFTLLYAALGVVWFMLLRRYVREGVRTQRPPADQEHGSDAAAPALLSFDY